VALIHNILLTDIKSVTILVFQDNQSFSYKVLSNIFPVYVLNLFQQNNLIFLSSILHMKDEKLNLISVSSFQQ
jgi:hypothetical protein